MTYLYYPPTYYNHSFEHPILWNKDRKRWVEQKLANECYLVWQTQKQLDIHKKLREQEEYRDMSNNWNPWGRRGNGAPNQDIRIRNLEDIGLYPINKNNQRNAFTLPRKGKNNRFFPPAMSGGGGDIIRSESGKMQIPFREDPSIMFNNSTRNYAESELRYKKTHAEQAAYRQDLDRLVHEKKQRNFNDKYGNTPGFRIQEENDPWGKPGPGGTQWRDQRNVGQNFMKSMGWSTKDTLRSMKSDMNQLKSIPIQHQTEYPQQQQQQQPQYTPPKFKGHTNKTSCCDRCSCECIKKIENTLLRNTSPPRQVQDHNNYHMNNIEEPPHKTPKNISHTQSSFTPHYQLPQQCNRTQLDPMDQQQFHQTSSTKAKPKATSLTKKGTRNCMITGGVELVPLLAKRQNDDHPINLSSTDITKYKINKSSWNDGGVEYLNHLERQVAQKQRLRQIHHDREVETSRQHFDTWDNFWGRPGCGAPQENKNKLKLDDLLYNVPMYQTQYQQQH